MILLILLLVGGLSAIVHAGVLDGLFKKSPEASAKAAGVVESSDQVTIPLKSLDSGKAIFLQTESEGRTLYFLALKTADGKYRSSLDACDVCFRANRGYRQEGDQLVCNNCNQKFAANKLGEAKGGCNPHPLAHRIEGTNMVIQKADIAAGKNYFQRKRS
ncbi:MAG TPA: DUF2318 domain-containing protein [Candidatus Deferrimicrobiaceae bacterium]|jgi:uncharacterized membrane protein